MTPRLLTGLILAAIAGLYYASGLYVAIAADSPGYLAPALTFWSRSAPPWPAARDLGYPAFLLPLVTGPSPALQIGLAQVALTVAAYAVLRSELLRSAVAAMSYRPTAPSTAPPWLTPALAITGLYGALHALIGTVLPEILLASVALFAVVSAQRFMQAQLHSNAAVIAMAAAATLPAAFAMTIKPHWYLAGAFVAVTLSLASAWKLHRLTDVARRGPFHGLLLAVALIVPLAILTAFVVTNRSVVKAYADPASLVFGERTAFCNNAHLILRAVKADPSITLNADAPTDRALKTYLGSHVPAGLGKWAQLGFDGDSCMYDPELTRLTDAHGVSLDAKRRIYVGALTAAARAKPWIFVSRVAWQMAYGLVGVFNRPAVVYRTDTPTALNFFGDAAGVAAFTRGTRQQGASGLLAHSEAAVKSSIPRMVVRAILVAGFTLLSAVYVALCLLALFYAPFAWKHWPPERRRIFLVGLAVPLGTILMHNALIALVHTFDIWRYSFNMFFVHILFGFNAAIFFATEPNLARARNFAGTLRLAKS